MMQLPVVVHKLFAIEALTCVLELPKLKTLLN